MKPDFLMDFVKQVESALHQQGISEKASSEDGPVIFLARALEFDSRLIAKTKRTVHLSKQLLDSKEYQNHNQAVQNLQALCEAGDDLTPYQSKFITKFKHPEFILFDWGIQHLHLGEHKAGQKFSERTGPLLFARFDANDAYYIAVLRHGAWAEIELLDIMDNQWPQLLSKYILSGIHDINPVPSAEETLELRKAGVTVMQKLNSGKIIAPPGGGITTARTSTSAMLRAQQLARRIRNLEDFTNKNKKRILNSLSGKPKDIIQLSGVCFDTNSASLKIKGSHKRFIVPFP